MCYFPGRALKQRAQRGMNQSFILADPNQSNPAETRPPLRRQRTALLFLVAWTAFAGLALVWIFRSNAGPSVRIIQEGQALQPGDTETFHAWFQDDFGFQRVFPWILFGPYVALLVSCFPLERGQLRLSLPLNIVGCAVFVVAAHLINVRTSITRAKIVVVKSRNQADRETSNLEVGTNEIEPSRITGLAPREFPDSGLTNVLFQLHPGFMPPLPHSGAARWDLWPTLLDLLAYGAVIGVAHSVYFYRRFREREHRALVLESNLANTRLNALRTQLQPHFLFNSLNAVVTLLRRDPKLAESTLLSLSELLRFTLSHTERQEVALREELQFVQHYLVIQQVRFYDKLRVEQDIEPAALDCLVPTLLLQPLVENAIRHGIEPAENAGLLRLSAHRLDARLVLTVEDDGVGIPGTNVYAREPKLANQTSTLAPTNPVPERGDASPLGTGIGLSNLRARLQTLYGTDQALELHPRLERGVTVRIEIPWRLETPPGTSRDFDPS